MRIGSDINIFYGKYSIEEAIDMLSDAEFEVIDFTAMDKRYFNGEISEQECKKHYTELKKYAEDKGMCFVQAHAPCPSSTSDDVQTEILFGNIVRSMRNASYLGAKMIVVHGKDHLVHETADGAERLFEMNMEFYNSLKPYCEEYGIKVALENLPQSYQFADIHKYFGCQRVVKSVCSEPEEFIRYLDTLNSEWFVACLDIGHAMITGETPELFIRKLGGDRLKALHIHDNDGRRDMHTIPYLGGMADWDKIMDALRDINYSGDFTYEAGNFLNPLPKELYPIGVRMMAETGKYLVNKNIIS